MPQDIRQTVLPNGITIVTDRAPHFEGAAVQCTFRAGSMDEPDDKAGMAHLLEHLVFRGSRNRSGEEIQNVFNSIGGEFNATTDEDTTAYYATVLHDDVGRVLEVFGDMLTHPALAAEDIVLEKQIVEQENCRGCWNCTMREGFLEASFPGQTISHPIIGTQASVESITRDDLVAFHGAAYRKGALVVAVAGNVDHDAIVALTETHFAELSEGGGMARAPLTYDPGELLLSSGSDTGVLRLAFSHPMARDAEARKRDVFMDILGGHANSQLMRELREKHGLVYGVWGAVWGVADRDMPQFEVRGDAAKMPEIVTLMADVVTRAAEHISESECDTFRRRFDGQERMMLDDLSSRCGAASSGALYFGAPPDPVEKHEMYASFTAAEIAATGRAMLGAKPVMIASGPMRTMPRFPAIQQAFSISDAGLRQAS